jgi:hypothetical protein
VLEQARALVAPEPGNDTSSMAERNLLVVLLEDPFTLRLREAIERRGGGKPNVHIVAPARLGPLEWLATDDDDARAEASVRALAGEWSLAGESEVEGEAGEADPVLAVEDALHHFPADEILLAGGASEDGGVEVALRRFGLPVTRLRESLPVRKRSALREAIRGLARGHSRATPFVLFTGVNLALLMFATLITLVVLLIL